MQIQFISFFNLSFLLLLISHSITKTDHKVSADELSMVMSTAPETHRAELHTVTLTPEIMGRARPDNETIYRVSKELCWGCIGESLQFLFAHNWVRAGKWEMPLIWDFQLEKYAKRWAMQRKGDCSLQHSFPEGDFKLGENIYWGSGTTWTPGDAVNAWAGEEKYYVSATNTCQAGEMCGHYTQIVWRNTRRIGCARVACDDGDVFMTCNYAPPGNIIGERPF